MQIFDYFSDEQKCWIEKIRSCDWSAAKLLADLIENNNFHKLLGDGTLLIMADGEKLVSFCTFSQKDCIDDDSMCPWIGFVFTVPEYRGNRYSGELIEKACAMASSQGYERVYVATDHIGLYEKYGFDYLGNRLDIYGADSRIYQRIL